MPITTRCHRLIFLFTLLFAFANHAWAVLDIRITKGMEEALPIAIVPFGWSQGGTLAPIEIANIISANLTRSGRFISMDEQDLPQRPKQFDQVNFQDWRLLGMENLVIGNLVLTDAGDYEVEFRLFDVYREKQIAGFRIPSTQLHLRRTAHQISDIIYEKITGVKGAFSTRIAYITVNKKVSGEKIHTLNVADADGFNNQPLVTSPEPLMSPNWSPDGKRLAYVSFEEKNSAIYIQDVITGKREKIQSTTGINSAPAWSPDGKRLAMTLSKDGNPEIYIKHLSTGLLQRITKNSAIDTEPTWSVDGDKLAFTSDRTGGPQIYEVDVEGGQARRLTFEGKYNTRPIYSPDGNTLVMVHGTKGSYRIAIMERGSSNIDILTDTKLDESPSFSPNGHMIIYATMGFHGTELAAVSSDGRVHQRLGLQEGEVREPAWGPFPE